MWFKYGVLLIFLHQMTFGLSLENLIPKPKFEGEWKDIGETFDVEAVLKKYNVEKQPKLTQEVITKSDKCVCPACPNQEIQETIDDNKFCEAFHALLNEITKKTSIVKTSKSVIFKTTIFHEELDELKEFVTKSCHYDETVMFTLVRIISALEIDPSEGIMGYVKTFKLNPKNTALIQLLTISSMLFLLLLWMWYFSRSWTQVLIKGFLLTFIVSCSWTWMQKYQAILAQKEANRVKFQSDMPAECFPAKLTMFQSIAIWWKDSFTFRDDPCVKYHQHVVVDPLWEANPFVAVSDTVSRILLHPLEVTGEKLSLFFRNFYKGLPVQFWVPLTLLIVFFIFMLMIMQNKYRIKLPIFLGVIEPGDVANSGNRLLANEPGPQTNCLTCLERSQNSTSLRLSAIPETTESSTKGLESSPKRLERLPIRLEADSEAIVPMNNDAQQSSKKDIDIDSQEPNTIKSSVDTQAPSGAMSGDFVRKEESEDKTCVKTDTLNGDTDSKISPLKETVLTELNEKEEVVDERLSKGEFLEKDYEE